MIDHPLTDDIIWSLWSEGDRSQLAEEKLARAAADWQLKQVTEFIAAHPMLGEDVALYFFKAMRPQQQEDN